MRNLGGRYVPMINAGARLSNDRRLSDRGHQSCFAENRAAGARTLAGAERDCIEKTLSATGGRIEGPGGAARILGMRASTLRSRIRKLGINR